MASNQVASNYSSFESHVRCPVCLDTYTNPVSLKCRHSACKHCIDRLVKRNGDVVCPQCRTTSRSHDIVRDFQLKSLVDTLKAEPPKHPCGICQAKAFGFYCQQCKVLVCSPCKLNHKNIPSCRDHSFSFDSYHKDYPPGDQLNVEGVEKSGIGSDQAVAHFLICAADMEKFALEKVDRAETLAIEQVKQHHSELRSDIAKEYELERALYMRRRQELQSTANSLKSQLEPVVRRLLARDPISAMEVLGELKLSEVIKREVAKVDKKYSLDSAHSLKAPNVHEGRYCLADPVDEGVANCAELTSVDFTSFKLHRDGAFMEDAVEEWKKASTHSGVQSGDRVLTPTRDRTPRSPPGGSRWSRRSRDLVPGCSHTGGSNRRPSRSPVTSRDDPRPSSHSEQPGSSSRSRSRISRSRSPRSRSRSRTPIPGGSSSPPPSREHSYSYQQEGGGMGADPAGRRYSESNSSEESLQDRDTEW